MSIKIRLEFIETYFQSIEILLICRFDNVAESLKYLRSIKNSSPSKFRRIISHIFELCSCEKMRSIHMFEIYIICCNLMPFAHVRIPDTIRSDHSENPIPSVFDIANFKFIRKSCWSPPGREELWSRPCFLDFFLREGEDASVREVWSIHKMRFYTGKCSTIITSPLVSK